MNATLDSAEYEADVHLRDGSTVHLRSARAHDRDAVQAFYEKLSPESRYFRFFGKPRVSAVVDDVVRAVGSDGVVTLLAEVDHRVVAIGQYFPSVDLPGRAEAAFAVSDTHQGHGIGTKLLERLGAIARGRGITVFEAYLLFDNQKMRRVFADAGFGVTWDRVDGQVTRVVLSLGQTEALHEKTAARSRSAARASLTSFFQPHIVAVVGAGRHRGGIGAEICHNLIAGGFRGRVVPVNVSGGEVEGMASVTRVTAIDGDVSLAVIAVPCDQVPAVVDDCIAKGVKALLIISAGFGETGGPGCEREAAILEKVRAAGIRMMGPNCMGIINTRVAAHGEWRRRPRGTVPAFGDLRVGRARAIVEHALASGGGWLAAEDVHGVIEAFGIAAAIPVPAANEEEAVIAARRVEGPVALKAVGPGILHKTEIGGVALGLMDDEAVRRAYREMAQRLGDSMRGVIVQRMVSGGVEVLVGATLDSTFGPVIACGTGGTLVELFSDVVFRLQPLTDIDAAEMVSEMKGAPLLRGFRGTPVADEVALRDALLRVSALMESCPEIQEMDINPLKALPRGICAIDARIRVERPRQARSRRISY